MEESPLNPPESEPHRTPKVVLYRVLSMLWIFPSLGAIWIMASGTRITSHREGIAGIWDRVRLEDWIGGTLLLLHLLWVWRWSCSRKQEP